jgi:hypothetical protein
MPEEEMTLDQLKAAIIRLEQEREAIFGDAKVTGEEHPRLAAIEHELPRLWDLRRRLEAARAAGLDYVPVARPSVDPNDMVG